MPAAASASFSASRSCVTATAAGDGRTGTRSASHAERGDGHVLQLDRDHVAAAGQLGQRRRVVVGRGDHLGHDRRRRVGRRLDHDAARSRAGTPASASMRPSWPPPRMPTVVTARGGRGGPARRRSGAGRHARSRSRSSGRDADDDGRRQQAGVLRTGRPDGHRARPARRPGICTIDSSESSPCSALDCDRHAEDRARPCGRPACPGRWAAPPAPAMITSMPSASACAADLGQQVRACGGPTRPAPSTARSSSSSTSTACPHRLPVRPGAHDDGDQGGIAGVCHSSTVRSVRSPHELVTNHVSGAPATGVDVLGDAALRSPRWSGASPCGNLRRRAAPALRERIGERVAGSAPGDRRRLGSSVTNAS